MALVTTPGAADADAYVSLAAAAAYAVAHGLTFAIEGDDEAPAEQAVRRATAWIDATFLTSFPGTPTNVDQALEWPRSGVTFRGEELADDTIPVQVVRATVEAAVREKASPGSLSPDVTPGEIVKSERVEGVVDVEYFGTGRAKDQRPDISVIEGILAPLLGARTNASFFARA